MLTIRPTPPVLISLCNGFLLESHPVSPLPPIRILSSSYCSLGILSNSHPSDPFGRPLPLPSPVGCCLSGPGRAFLAGIASVSLRLSYLRTVSGE